MDFAEILNKANEIGRNLPALIGKLPSLPERDLRYRDGAYGISEILMCPKKAEIRRKLWEEGIELPLESQEVEDGFLFENLIKLSLAVLYGDKFTPEATLSYDLLLDDERTFKIDGHLDCLIETEEKIIGIELKHTNIAFDNTLTDRPPQLIILNSDDRNRIEINHKYYLQAQIQRLLLEKLYPGKKVEMYLFIKTQLRTKYKLGKTNIVLPVEKSISEKELKEICEQFITDKNPRAGWECHLCNYKKHNYCEGVKAEDVNKFSALEDSGKEERIKKLLERIVSLKSELKNLEEQAKRLIDGEMEWNGKKIGWVNQISYSYDLVNLSKLLKEKGLPVIDYLQIKAVKVKQLEKILGDEIEKVRTARQKKRFILP